MLTLASPSLGEIATLREPVPDVCERGDYERDGDECHPRQGLGDKAKKVPSIPSPISWRGWRRCSIRLSGDGYISQASGDPSRRRRRQNVEMDAAAGDRDRPRHSANPSDRQLGLSGRLN